MFSIIILILINLSESFNIPLLNSDNKFSIPALITPMTDDMNIDYKNLEKMIDYTIKKNSDAIVILGSTGEGNVISHKERKKIIKTAKSITQDDIPIIVGTGEINPYNVISNTNIAKKYGADIAMIISPYYVKPTQQGIIEYYKIICENTDIPIIIYDCPSRTNSEMEIETIFQISKNKNIIGIKDSSGNINKMKKIRQLCGDDFILLSGDDKTCFDFCSNGGNGCISVVGNVYPKLVRNMIHLSEKNTFASFEIFQKLSILINLLETQTNPMPVKYATYTQMFFEEIWKEKDYGIRCPLELLPYNLQLQINDAISDINIYENNIYL